jgi:hypothetical protein
VHASKIVVVGRSLGGAVAVSLAAKLTLQLQHDSAVGGEESGSGAIGKAVGAAVMPAALVIENSFTSISDMVRSVVGIRQGDGKYAVIS